MRLAVSALQSVGAPFDSFMVEKAVVNTDEVKSLFSVLNDLGDRGLVDSYFSSNALLMKCSKIGKAELVTNQIKGHYDIEFTNEQINCEDPDAKRQIFYRAFRRLLLSKGYTTGVRPSLRRRSSPSYGNPISKKFVLRIAADNVFLQGFRYLLELRGGGHSLLWLDPRVSVFNTFAGKFLSKSQIIAAGLPAELKKWSVVEPRVRLSRAESIVAHLCNGESLEIGYADGTKASFSRHFMGSALE